MALTRLTKLELEAIGWVRKNTAVAINNCLTFEIKQIEEDGSMFGPYDNYPFYILKNNEQPSKLYVQTTYYDTEANALRELNLTEIRRVEIEKM